MINNSRKIISDGIKISLNIIVNIFRKISGFILFSIIPLIVGLIMLFISKLFHDGIKSIEKGEQELSKKFKELDTMIENIDEIVEKSKISVKTNLDNVYNTLSDNSLVSESLLKDLDNANKSIINAFDLVLVEIDDKKPLIMNIFKELLKILSIIKKIITISADSYLGLSIFFFVVSIVAALFVILSKFHSK